MNINVRPDGSNTAQPMEWPEGALTRVPYWIYQSPEIYAAEQRRVFEGPTWNYLCLDAEVAEPGDYRTTFVGTMPVVVARDFDEEIYAFENRCAHRGALIALDFGGKARDFTCVYHAWNYDLKGNLKAVAFEDGVAGHGGMPKDFLPLRPRAAQIADRDLRRACVRQLVRRRASDRGISRRGDRRQDQARAAQARRGDGPLHPGPAEQLEALFREREGQLSRQPAAHVLHHLPHQSAIAARRIDDLAGRRSSRELFLCAIATKPEHDYAAMGLRSEKEDFALKDASLLDTVDEIGDGCNMQILTVFPGLVVQQIQNALAIRQILPKGLGQTALNWTVIGFADDTPEMRTRRHRQNNLAGPAGYVSMEDGCVGGFVQRGIAAAADERAVLEMGGAGTTGEGTRATEASVRGFWKCYRTHMGSWTIRITDGRRDHGRAHPRAAGRLYPLHRQQRAGGVAGLFPRSLPLQGHHRREPQATALRPPSSMPIPKAC